MAWVLWVVIAWLVWSVIATVSVIGKPRKPITPGLGAGIVLVWGVVIAALAVIAVQIA